MISEEAIIEGCKASDRLMQKLLFQKYSSKMLGICLRYSKDKHEAEDVMMEGFMIIFEKIKQFKNEGSFEGWMKRVMVNLAISNYRKNLKHYYSEDVSDFEFEGNFTNQLDNLSAKELLSSMQKLPEGYRVIFNLFVVEGYSHNDIAEKLKISVGTSKSQLSKARKSFQALILKNNDSK